MRNQNTKAQTMIVGLKTVNNHQQELTQRTETNLHCLCHTIFHSRKHSKSMKTTSIKLYLSSISSNT